MGLLYWGLILKALSLYEKKFGALLKKFGASLKNILGLIYWGP
jgi:hypothetical protein